jgi:hypothetical protein
MLCLTDDVHVIVLQLTLNARDGGNRLTPTTVTITTNRNRNTPLFTNVGGPNFAVSFNNNITINTIVYSAVATDADSAQTPGVVGPCLFLFLSSLVGLSVLVQ